MSLPSPPMTRSLPWLPMKHVVAEAAVHRELRCLGRQAEALMTSSPPGR